MLLKVITVKNVLFATLSFFNYSLKYQDFVSNDCHAVC